MFYAYYCATSTPRRNANNCYGPIESNFNGLRGGEEVKRGGRRRGWDRIGLAAILALNKLQLFFRVRDSFQPTDRQYSTGSGRAISIRIRSMGPAAKLIRL